MQHKLSVVHMDVGKADHETSGETHRSQRKIKVGNSNRRKLAENEQGPFSHPPPHKTAALATTSRVSLGGVEHSLKPVVA